MRFLYSNSWKSPYRGRGGVSPLPHPPPARSLRSLAEDTEVTDHPPQSWKQIDTDADLYSYVQVGEYKWPRYKNNENHAFTMKSSMNFQFLLVYENNYSTLVYEGNIIRFSLF